MVFRTSLAQVPHLLDFDGKNAIENGKRAKDTDDNVELAQAECRHLARC